jgi:hypothetical protein
MKSKCRAASPGSIAIKLGHTEQPSRHDAEYTFGAGAQSGICGIANAQRIGTQPNVENPGSAIAKRAGADFVRSYVPSQASLKRSLQGGLASRSRLDELGGRTARNAEPVDPAIRTTHKGQSIECVLLTGRRIDTLPPHLNVS